MYDPFKLVMGLLVAILRISIFSLIFIAQVAWFLLYKKPEKIGDALGWYGKEVVEALSSALRR